MCIPLFILIWIWILNRVLNHLGNEGTVHHFILYLCPEEAVTGEVNHTHQYTCDQWTEQNMPSPDCRLARRQFGWAVGGTQVWLPEHAGIPMSGDSNFHYAFMEMHYDVECRA